jgi:hypothetical protein
VPRQSAATVACCCRATRQRGMHRAAAGPSALDASAADQWPRPTIAAGRAGERERKQSTAEEMEFYRAAKVPPHSSQAAARCRTTQSHRRAAAVHRRTRVPNSTASTACTTSSSSVSSACGPALPGLARAHRRRAGRCSGGFEGLAARGRGGPRTAQALSAAGRGRCAGPSGRQPRCRRSSSPACAGLALPLLAFMI